MKRTIKKGGRKKTARKKKGGKKTGEFYTVIKGWTPEQEPPYHPNWRLIDVPKKNKILFLTIGDRIELRSKKTKIDTCAFHGMKIVTEFEEIGYATYDGQFYDRLVPDCVSIGTKEWIKVKRNNGEVGWILHKLLKTHLEKAGSKSKRRWGKRSKRSSKGDLFYDAKEGPRSRSRSRSRSRGDLFYSAERGPSNPTGALQPTFREEMRPLTGVDYSGALQPSKRLSEWNWHPSMRPDLTLYGRK